MRWRSPHVSQKQWRPSDVSSLDYLVERVNAGEPLTADHLSQLAATPDILLLGMLADTVRRGLHGQKVTYVRVASYPADMPPAVQHDASAAREVRVTGAPASIDGAVSAL